MRSDRRLKGHPQIGPKYEAEGRARPDDPFVSSRAVPLHYPLAHQDSRVVLDASGAPALHHEALDYITAHHAMRGSPSGRWLTVGQVARLLEVDARTLRARIEAGTFPAEQPLGPASAYRIPTDRLEAHLYAAGCAHSYVRELRATWTAWLAADAEARDA
jgi:excisionase family DNA binding protein